MKIASKTKKIKHLIISPGDLKITLDLILSQIESIKGELDLNKIFNVVGEGLIKIKISSVISIIDEKKENFIIRYIKLNEKQRADFLKIKIEKIPVKKFKQYQIAFEKKHTLFCKNRISQLKKCLPELKFFLNKIKENNSIISPLILKKEVIGFIEIFSKNLSEKDIDLVKDFSQELVLRITNSILFYEVKKSEERYRELWDNAPIAYHVLDNKGIIRKVNKTEATILGYPQELMIGKSIFEFILPEQRGEARERFRLKISGQKIPKKEVGQI